MTRDEVKKILMIIESAYPNYKPPNKTNAIDVWNLMLEEYTYQQVSVALKSYILSDTAGFPPSIGQLVGKLQTIQNPNPHLNEMEAWGLVSKALKNGTYGADEEFAKLPELVQKAVGSASQLRNWATTDSNSIENVVQSNFMRTYRGVCSRENEISKMPTEIKNMITQNSKLEAIDTKTKTEIKQLDVKNYDGVPMPESIKKQIDLMKRGEK